MNETLAVLFPTRAGQIAYETHCALHSNFDGIPSLNITEARKPVIEARNGLAQKVLLAKKQFTIDLALWIDADCWFAPGTIAKMLQVMDQRPDLDMLGAYSSDRMPFCAGALFKLQKGKPVPMIPAGAAWKDSVPRFTEGEVVDVDMTSFHLVITRTKLLERLGPDPFNLPEDAFFGEDFQFCVRARQAGAKIAVDTSTLVAHVDVESGFAFVPNQRPGIIAGNAFGIIPDPRTDQEIHAQWTRQNVRAKRSYGGNVDAALKRAFDDHVRALSV